MGGDEDKKCKDKKRVFGIRGSVYTGGFEQERRGHSM
jgi:hypothetical protein